MNFIINADDFGKSESRNYAVHECMMRGYADRASLLVNMAFDEAVSLAKKGGYADRVGLHLNLAEGNTLLANTAESILCANGAEGRFAMKCPLGDSRFLARHLLDVKSILSIRKEIVAQIELFRGAGFTSNHIDSHCWSHLEVPVIVALLPIMSKYGFVTVRSSWGLIGHHAQGSRLNRYWKLASWFYRGRVSEAWSGLAQEYIAEYWKYKLAGKICEIYCHPDVAGGEVIDTKFDRSYRHVRMSEYRKEILISLDEV